MSNVNHKTAKERTAERIKASKILTRLQRFVLAKEEDDDYEAAQMTQQKVNAAKILLGKVVPDLKQMEHRGDFTVKIDKVVQTIVDPEPTNS
jgi:hypothetical protein